MKKSQSMVVGGLFALALATMGSGIYLKHYFVVTAFSLWLSIEIFLWRFNLRYRLPAHGRRTKFGGLTALLDLHDKFDHRTEEILEQKIIELKMFGQLSSYDLRWLERLRDLIQLRGLTLSQPLGGKKRLRQGFGYCVEVAQAEKEYSQPDLAFQIQDVTESATIIADLYWKLYDACFGGYEGLTTGARTLFENIFGIASDHPEARSRVEKLTDSMQRYRGVPFLIFNLIRRGDYALARQIAQTMVTHATETETDPEWQTPIYWLEEILTFHRSIEPIVDYDSTLKYLYHLCFTQPERAGFLEVDSRFFSQFAMVNELAREGFLFKEVLVEQILDVWQEYQGIFDGVFQSVLERVVGKRSKVIDSPESWKRFWLREKRDFSRDYLHVVEGNLSYCHEMYVDARIHFESALSASPGLLVAKLNLLFVYAKLGLLSEHQALAASLLDESSRQPSILYRIGNSFLLANNEILAEKYFRILNEQAGWDSKIDYYKSIFCYEHGLFPRALQFALKAHAQNPGEKKIVYHLSLCYRAVGRTEEALATVKQIGEGPEWMNYYRFTLERDAGNHAQASETLLKIPAEYFDDAEEWNAAIDFAKANRNFLLLKHLRR